MVEWEAPSWEWTSATRKAERFTKCTRARSSTPGCWLSWTGLWLDEPTPPSNKRYWRGCSWAHQPVPLSLSKMMWKLKLPGWEDKMSVVVGIITDNVHMQEVPKLEVCVFCESSPPWAMSSRPGGKFLTFNQLALHPQWLWLGPALWFCKDQEMDRHLARPREPLAATLNLCVLQGWGVPVYQRLMGHHSYKN